MEPQPQLQPINPVDGRPFAEPPQPLDLRPKTPRRPLDLRPRPNPNPTQVPDLRPARADELRQSMNPLDRTNLQGMRENVGRVANNPIGYAPGKGLVNIATTILERSQALSTPDAMETLDVPAIPLPADSFPDLETTPTTRLSSEAIGQGSLMEEGQDAIPDGTGSRSIPYVVRAEYTGPEGTYVWQGTFVGPVSAATHYLRLGSLFRSIPRVASAGRGLSSLSLVSGPNSSVDNYSGYVSFTYSFTPADGSTDQQEQPATPPRYASNPARQPFPGGLPDFLEMPELDLPGFQPEPRLLPAPAPTGEIVPYRPPGWTPDPAEPYLPNEPYKTPGFPTAPDLDNPPGRQNQDDPTKKGTLAPPWWDAWEGWQPPDAWTNKKRNPRGEDDPQLPAPQNPQQPPPVATVPYDGCCIETLNRLRDIQRRLEKLEVDSEIPAWKCDTTADPPTPTEERNAAKDLTTAINLIGESLGLIQQQLEICPPPPVDQAEHAEIAKDTATESKTVWYIPLAPEVRQVELIITGELPKSFRLYDTSADGEQQAKFGALALSCSGVTGGNTANSFHQWCWTRRTSMYVGHRSPRENFLRVYIRSGLSWVLYDTGLRE